MIYLHLPNEKKRAKHCFSITLRNKPHARPLKSNRMCVRKCHHIRLEIYNENCIVNEPCNKMKPHNAKPPFGKTSNVLISVLFHHRLMWFPFSVEITLVDLFLFHSVVFFALVAFRAIPLWPYNQMLLAAISQYC